MASAGVVLSQASVQYQSSKQALMGIQGVGPVA